VSQKTLSLSFEEMTEADIPELTKIMTRAFDDDARKHRGLERGGPEGYDDGEFFRTWLLPYKESVGYKILSEGQIIGGIIVWILPEGHNILGTIFVDPAYQDRGVGTRTWQFVETAYPDQELATGHPTLGHQEPPLLRGEVRFQQGRGGPPHPRARGQHSLQKRDG
jgi:GNAT superfamily N-acetyltransferase